MARESSEEMFSVAEGDLLFSLFRLCWRKQRCHLRRLAQGLEPDRCATANQRGRGSTENAN